MAENSKFEQDIASAKRTIDKEVEALRMMENSFDESLTKALDLMQSCKGRVIVTGMGKSGHIACNFGIYRYSVFFCAPE